MQNFNTLVAGNVRKGSETTFKRREGCTVLLIAVKIAGHVLRLHYDGTSTARGLV